MAAVSFGTFSKRKNSTKQPLSLSDQRTVTLKESCSQDRPVFVCTGNNFNYNYCMWDSKYYFINDKKTACTIDKVKLNGIIVYNYASRREHDLCLRFPIKPICWNKNPINTLYRMWKNPICSGIFIPTALCPRLPSTTAECP